MAFTSVLFGTGHSVTIGQDLDDVAARVNRARRANSMLKLVRPGTDQVWYLSPDSIIWLREDPKEGHDASGFDQIVVY
jgi:hypothetical protein